MAKHGGGSNIDPGPGTPLSEFNTYLNIDGILGQSQTDGLAYITAQGLTDPVIQIAGTNPTGLIETQAWNGTPEYPGENVLFIGGGTDTVNLSPTLIGSGKHVVSSSPPSEIIAGNNELPTLTAVATPFWR
jgi:hypothetical protein